MGLFQEALEAMFALINEMELAIKINTSIIFGNRARLMWEKFSGCAEKKKKKKKKGGGEPGGEKLHQHERGLGALPFLVGCVKRLFLVYFKPAAFKSDTTQVSSSIHTLWVLDAARYLCGNIIMVWIYWQWHRGIRVSLFVPQDERVFLSLAPEAMWTVSRLHEWPPVRADSGHVWIMLSVLETMRGAWIQWEERMRRRCEGRGSDRLSVFECQISRHWSNGNVFKKAPDTSWAVQSNYKKHVFSLNFIFFFWFAQVWNYFYTKISTYMHISLNPHPFFSCKWTRFGTSCLLRRPACKPEIDLVCSL